jgi:hypothetical protein
MAKKFGFSAAAASLAYIRDNANILFICASAPQSYSAASNEPNMIVSANISAADFTLASAATGAELTIGAKPSQAVEGSGLATHIALVKSSGTALLYVVNGSAKVLASGDSVSTTSFTITVLASANNS